MNEPKTIPSAKIVATRISQVHTLLDFSPVAPFRRPVKLRNMAGRIEHTLLNINASSEDVDKLCAEAVSHHFRSVCCLPRDVAQCKHLLKGSDVLVVTVIDFPLGGGVSRDVSAQCATVIELGADEVDMVVDVRAILKGDLKAAVDGVGSVVWAAGAKSVKVILETGLLTFNQIVDGCAVAEIGGAHFVKTCTGFGPRGASLNDILLMRLAVGDRLGLKASGGIKNHSSAQTMIDAGADLIGTSSGAMFF